MASLAGRWKFIKDGSDFLPGIDKLPNSPLVTKLQGFDEDEVFEIEKVHYSSVEEITFTYDDKIKRSYQVGTLNYQTINSSNVSISVVQVCNHDFTEITVLHMGPECGQNSKEIYRLDVNRRHMKVVVEIVTGDGTTLSLIKYLGRSGDSPPVDVSQFQNVVLTLGWKLFEYWPSTILTSCQAKLVRVIKLQATAVGTSDEKYFTEVMWPSQSSAADAKDMDYSRIAVKFGSRNSLGEEVVLYVFQVKVGQAIWEVAHRYTEFDIMRMFMLAQNPFNSAIKESSERFPGKVVMLAYRPLAFEQRIHGLEKFVLFCLENAKFCRQNTIDAWLAFLDIPDHMKPISQMVDDSLENALGSSLSMPPKIFPRQFQNDANEGDPAHDGVASDNFYNRRTQSNGEGYSAIHSMNGDSKNDHSPRNQPKEVLLSKLRHGFTVIKHGRHGAPHKRILTCDDRVTKLYWQSENDAKNKKVHSVNESEGKHINLADVTAVITGADLDPTVMNGMPGRKGSFESISSNITSSTMADKPRRKRRFTLSSSQDEIVYGTANLRRHCSPEDMPLCISLITPDRTFDIQCLNKDDFNLLYYNLSELIGRMKNL